MLAGDKDKVAGGLTELSSEFTDRNLLLHPGEVQHEHIKALGVVLDGVNLLCKLSSERFHRVRQALRCLLRRNRCTGRTLEIVIGHCTYCGLCNRCVLSVFHNVYKFIQSSYSTSCTLWPSVASELRAFAGLMPLLRSAWRRPWSSTVTVSDASESGYGVCSSTWSSNMVGDIGRVHERERFRRTGSHNAREAALTAAGFVKDEVTGKWQAGLLDDEDYLASAGWALNESFPEIPKSCLDGETWSTVCQGQWKRREHIVHLEARALVKSFEHVVEDGQISHCRQLFLVDSMSAALAFDRCRSKNFRMLRQIRKFCSFSLARNIAFSVRWLPSELNPADAPSRAKEPEQLSLHGLVHSPPCSLSHASEENCGAGASKSRCQFEQPSTQEVQGAAAGCLARGQEEQSRAAVQLPCGGVSADPAELCLSKFRQPGLQVEPLQVSASSACVGPEQQQQQLQQQLEFPKSEEEEKRQNLSQAKQAPPQEIRGRGHGSVSSGAQPLGKESHWGSNSVILSARVSGPPGLCSIPEEVAAKPQSVGSSPHRLFQRTFLQGAPWPPGRQDHGFLDAPQARVQQVWQQAAAPCLASPEGLATPSARQQPSRVSLGGLGSHCDRDEEAWTFADGPLYHDWPFGLHQTRGIAPMQSGQLDSSSARCDRDLVTTLEPRGVPSAIQSWGVRRQPAVRLSLFEALGPSAHEAVDPEGEAPVVVELRLWPILSGVRRRHKAPGLGHHPVCLEAQRPQHRHEQKLAVAHTSAEEREMAKPQECCPLRASCTAGGKLSVAQPATPAALPARRGTARGSDVKPGPSSAPSLRKKGRKGQYVADLFAGVGGVAHQCRRLGYRAKEWEISRGVQFDLTRPMVLKAIRQDIDKQLVLAAMLAPPCSSFSVARDRTCVIRTRQHPWGLPSHLLTTADKTRVENGNKCFLAALKIISWLDQHHIPWILENPSSSKCWFLPPLQDLMAAPHCVTVLTDFCQFGTQWRKRTQLLCGNLDSQDVARLERLCSGRGLCSRTGCKHFQLTGSNRQSIPWTRIAQPYPKELCKQLAFVLTCPTHYISPPW